MTEKLFEFDSDFGKRYDTLVRQSFFGYEQLFSITAALLKTRLKPEAQVLVVGSGTGMELLSFGQLMPDWQLTGIDPSAQMVQIAREKVEQRGFGEQVHLFQGFVNDLPEGENFDAATLILVLHFVPEAAGKLALLKNVAARLRPGGSLIYLSPHGDPTDPAIDELITGWKNFMVTNGMPQAGADKMIETAQASKQFVPEKEVLALLEEAGFTGLTRFYTGFITSGWIARKA